ncbi:MAG: hypothetical protein AB1531_07760 [Chloroflexota bacterium]
MSDLSNPIELKLQEAARFIKAGQKNQARQLLRDILISDYDCLKAWELLVYATYNIKEEAYCLERILALRPDHPWARQLLDAINQPAQTKQAVQEDKTPLPKSEPSTAKSTPAPSPAQQMRPPKTQPRRSRMAPLLLGMAIICSVSVLGFFLFVTGLPLSMASVQQTRTAIANRQVVCHELIQRALEASEDYCNRIDSNSVCYGNYTILAELIPDAALRFSERGDIVGVNLLRRLSVSPLNLDTQEWGIAIFKVLANLPRSLPGETVTLIVFGNTTIDNQSQNLESFYFSSGFGELVCEEVPFDGIMLSMPDGTGIEFTVNGSELTLFGNASLSAVQNGEMNIKLFSGSGQIASNGQTQSFGAGQQVNVPLGGANGVEAIGPPSAPVPLSPEDLVLACTMTDQYCSEEDILPVSADEAQETLEARLFSTPTPQHTSTRTSTPTISQTPSQTFTSTITFTPTTTSTSSKTSTKTLTPTKTRTSTRTFTPSRTPSVSFTPSRTATPTLSPTRTNTGAITFTPSPTRSPTITFTRTDTVPVCPISAGSLGTSDSKTLSINLTNESSSAVVLNGITVSWVESAGQVLKDIRLAGMKIADADDDNSSTNVPGEIPWFGTVSDRTIPAWATRTMEIRFQFDIESTGYSVSIYINADCQVGGSK